MRPLLSEERRRRWGARITEWDYRYVLPAIAAFPPAVAWRVAALRGAIRYRLRSDARRKALENIAVAFPEMPEAARAAAVRRSFQLLSRDEMESYWFDRPDSYLRRLIASDAELGVLREAVRNGRGVLALTGHLGCPGIFLCWSGRRGVKHRLLFRPLEDIPGQSGAWVEFGKRRIRSLERAAGQPYLAVSEVSFFRLRSILREGGVIVAAVDVVPWLLTQTLPARFLGRSCRFPRGLSRLYLDVRPEVVFWSCHGDPKGRYVFSVKSLTGELEPVQDIGDVTQLVVAELDRRIRESPGDWLQWDAFHYFWDAGTPEASRG